MAPCFWTYERAVLADPSTAARLSCIDDRWRLHEHVIEMHALPVIQFAEASRVIQDVSALPDEIVLKRLLHHDASV